MPETAYSVGDRVIALLQDEMIWPATIVHTAPTTCRCGAPMHVLEWECDCPSDGATPTVTEDGDEIWPTHVHSLNVPAHDLTTWADLDAHGDVR